MELTFAFLDVHFGLVLNLFIHVRMPVFFQSFSLFICKPLGLGLFLLNLLCFIILRRHWVKLYNFIKYFG